MKQFCLNLIKILKTRKGQIIILLAVGAFAGSIFYYFQKTEAMPEATIYFVNDVKTLHSGEKVLVYSPHPDDETLGAGGYVIGALKSGALVKIVLVTNGDKHHKETERYKEFQEATGKLGVNSNNLVYLNYADGNLSRINQDEVKASLKKELDQFSPNVVIYPSSKDTHPDHADVGRLVSELLKNGSPNIISYQYLIHNNRYPQPKKYSPDLYLLPPKKLVTFDEEWQRYMLSQGEEKIKEKAVNCYKSQLKTPILKSTMLSLIRRNELFTIKPN